MTFIPFQKNKVPSINIKSLNQTIALIQNQWQYVSKIEHKAKLRKWHYQVILLRERLRNVGIS